jgi:hypothetical protein
MLIRWIVLIVLSAVIYSLIGALIGYIKYKMIADKK